MVAHQLLDYWEPQSIGVVPLRQAEEGGKCMRDASLIEGWSVIANDDYR